MTDVHVDILEHDPYRGDSEVIARITYWEHEGLEVIYARDEEWRAILKRPVLTPEGKELNSIQSPGGWLRGLSTFFTGSYTTATDPHTDPECKFAIGLRIPLARLTEHQINTLNKPLV